jgi:hypothetical protein
MALTGKTGADAVFKALKRICIVLSHYSAKLTAVVDAAQADGKITTQQQTDAHLFIASALIFCTAFELVADYSGFDTNP